MKKITIMACVALLMSVYSNFAVAKLRVSNFAVEKQAQKVCVIIDKKAKGSIWSKRDNSAKFSLYGVYKNSAKLTNKDTKFGQTSRTEIYYNKSKVCRSVAVHDKIIGKQALDLFDLSYYFNNTIGVDIQYGGDCEFPYTPGKDVEVTVHRRAHDHVNPWYCTANWR